MATTAPTRARGHPSAAGKTRSQGILVRVLPEERTLLHVAARRAGLPLGAWLRALGIREATGGAPHQGP